jgi:hypothetical protein
MSTDPNEQYLPASVLRRALEDAGNPWSLDADVNDEASPPEFPLGGDPPPNAPRGDEVERTDFRALLQNNPPADPDLARVCVDAGLLDSQAVPSLQRRPRDQEAEGRVPDASHGPPPPEAGPDDTAPPVFSDRRREPT